MAGLHTLRRRTFLAALGLGVGAPLAHRMASLAVAAPAAVPVRVLNLFIPHGVPWEFADPAAATGLDLLAKGEEGVFAPLAPYASQVNFLRGIAMAGGQSNHDAVDTVWTGSASGTTDSFDYLIAQELGVKAQTLGAVPYSEFEGFNSDSYLLRHGGQWVRARESPAAAADEIFFGLGDGSGAVSDEAAFRAEAMDLTMGQIDRLAARAHGLSTEQSKLQQHLAALQQLKSSEAGAASTCTERPVMPRVEATRALNPLEDNSFGHVFDGHLELAGNAMVCGAAQVLSLQALWVNSNLRFNFEGGPGIVSGHHLELSHGPRAAYGQAQRWFMERLATVLLPILEQDDPMAPGSKVIDNSIIYISSEVSDGQNHNSDAGETWVAGVPSSPLYTTLPQLLIGGGGGCLKTGGHVIQVDEDRPHTDVMATIASALGVNLNDIGGNATKVIDEVLA